MFGSVQVYVIFLTVIFACYDIQAQNITTTHKKDLRTFLSDRLFVNRQIDCVLGKRQCDRLGNQLKKAIPEVVNRNCARCTSVQATNANKLMNFIQKNYPVAYGEILNKYRTNKASTRPQQAKIAGKPIKVVHPQSIVTNATTKSTGLQQTKTRYPQAKPTSGTGTGTAKVAVSRRTNTPSPQLTPKIPGASSATRRVVVRKP